MIKRATIMKVGKMKYLESELIPNGKTNKLITIIRDKEVLRKYHKTFINKPVQISHSDNGRIVGRVIDTFVTDKGISALLDIDILLLDTIELSCGYESTLKFVNENTYKLREFVGEHVAIVQNGRCGKTCSIQ